MRGDGYGLRAQLAVPTPGYASFICTLREQLWEMDEMDEVVSN